MPLLLLIGCRLVYFGDVVSIVLSFKGTAFSIAENRYKSIRKSS
jgi:hypothetical protein